MFKLRRFVVMIALFTSISFGLTNQIKWDQRYISSFERLLGVDDFTNLLPQADVVEVDVLDTPEWYITYLKKHDKLIIGYINAGAIETYREDFKLFPLSVIGKIYPGWEDERFLDIRQYGKFKDRMLRRLDLAKQKGFDAVEFDNIDIFENPQEVGFDIAKEDMINYLNWLLAEAHDRDLRVLQKNAPTLVPVLGDKFDGALLENSYQQGWAGKFRYYVDQNKPVFAIEYLPQISVEDFKSDVCPAFRQLGFVGLLKKLELDRWSVNCQNFRAKRYAKLTRKIDKILAKYVYVKLLKKASSFVVNEFNKYKLLLSKYNTNDYFKKQIIDYLVYKFQIYIYSFSRNKLLPSQDGIYFGAFQFFGNSEDQVSLSKLNEFKSLIGFKPVWAYFSLVFDQDGIKFPKQSINIITKYGEIPFLRLIPTLDLNVTTYNYSLLNIIKGKYDDELTRLAKDIKNYGKPILIDFAPEANGNWFPWSGRPVLFKQAYRHIVDIFAYEGVNNVTWFYHFNLPSFPQQNRNNPWAYYPGNEYVDWIGISLYGPLSKNDIQKFPSQLVKSYYKDLKKFAQAKPVAILEFGVDISFSGARQWYKDFFDTLISYQKDLNIKAISFWGEVWQNDDNSLSKLQISSGLIEGLQKIDIVSFPLFIK